MNIKSITYEFMGEETSYFILCVGDTLQLDEGPVVISSIRDVGACYNVYVKKLSTEQAEDRFKKNKILSPKDISKIEGKECVLYSIKSNQMIIQYYL